MYCINFIFIMCPDLSCTSGTCFIFKILSVRRVIHLRVCPGLVWVCCYARMPKYRTTQAHDFTYTQCKEIMNVAGEGLGSNHILAGLSGFNKGKGLDILHKWCY